MRLADVHEALGNLLVAARGDQSMILGAGAIDSRRVRQGDLFFALPGERHDAHDFVPEAFASGAVGAVISRPIEAPGTTFHVSDATKALQRLASSWRSRHDLRVIGVTGSVGKTTAKELIAGVLARGNRVLKTEANLNTEIGVPLTLLGLRPEHEVAVLELAMYQPGDIQLLCEIARPDVGVVLNVGPVHMERAGSIGRIASAKAELVEALPPSGLAVLNADDPRVLAMERRTSARVVTFGLSERASIRASSITSRGLDGFSFQLVLSDGSSRPVECRQPGSHHVYPILAAVAVAIEHGTPIDDVVGTVESLRVDLRLTVRPGYGGATIIDDSYNASPDSMIAALNLLAETPGRHIAVLGQMRELGAAEDDAHVRVGRHAARTSGMLVVVGDEARVIAEAATAAGHPDVQCFSAPDGAAAFIRGILSPGDHVLVKASRAVGLELLVETLQP